MPFTRFPLAAAALTLLLATAHAADAPRPVSNPAPRAAARQRG